MLHLSRAYGSLRDRWFRDFPDLLRPTDLVVFNNSKVIPARLFGRRLGVPAKKSAVLPSGKIEVLLLRQILQQPNQWNCLIRAGGKVDVGERLVLGEPDSSGEALCATVIGRGVSGERAIEFDPVPDFFSRLDHIGHMPLPPYIAREDRPEDRERYQTVFARERGSVAAPTAGLHFTPEILARLDESKSTNCIARFTAFRKTQPRASIGPASRGGVSSPSARRRCAPWNTRRAQMSSRRVMARPTSLFIRDTSSRSCRRC